MKTIALAFTVLVSAWAGQSAEPKPIRAVVGQEFKLTLESNPSTGNQWLIARPLDEQLLKLLGSEYRRGRPGAAAAGGYELLSFKALSEGKTQIRLKYGRLWERDT